MSPPKNMTPSVAGTVASFNNKGKKGQNFNNCKIRSGAIYDPNHGSFPYIGGTRDAFNNEGDGPHSFVGADIQSGAQVENEKEEDGTKDLWAQLEKIGVEKDSLGDVYLYLLKDPTALKAFNGIPIDQRKRMLPKILPNYPSKGSNHNIKLT